MGASTWSIMIWTHSPFGSHRSTCLRLRMMHANKAQLQWHSDCPTINLAPQFPASGLYLTAPIVQVHLNEPIQWLTFSYHFPKPSISQLDISSIYYLPRRTAQSFCGHVQNISLPSAQYSAHATRNNCVPFSLMILTTTWTATVHDKTYWWLDSCANKNTLGQVTTPV